MIRAILLSLPYSVPGMPPVRVESRRMKIPGVGTCGAALPFARGALRHTRISSLVGLVVLLSVISAPVFAHSPHDDVFDIACSGTSGEHGRVFAIARSTFLVSDDRGNTWRRLLNGLDHKHMLVALDIADEGRTIVIVSLGDGVFVSGDRGATWKHSTDGLNTRVLDTVAASPEKSGHVLVAGVEGGLYRTTNLGESWSGVDGDFGKVTAIVYLQDQSDHVILGDHRGDVYRSTDGGETWGKMHHLEGAGSITAMTASSGRDDDPVIMIATSSGQVFRSEPGTEALKAALVPSGGQPVVSLALSPDFAQDQTVFASVWHEGVYISRDAGNQWKRLDQGLTRDRQAKTLGRPSFSELCVSQAFSSDQTLFLAGFDGLFRSEDAGTSWKQLSTISPLNFVALSVAPNREGEDRLALVSHLWGALLSDDSGTSWRPVYNDLEESRDLGITRLFGMEFSPDFAHDSTLFTSTWYHFYTSRDAGRSWHKLPDIPLPEGASRHHGSYIAVSPGFREDRTLFAGTMPGLVLKSTDGGESYQVVENVQNLIGSVVISPAYEDDQTVLVGDTRGVHISRDGGASWEFSPLVDDSMFFEMPVSPGYWEDAASAWKEHVLTQREKEYGIRLAISPDFATDQTVFAGTPDGLLRSANGGGSWKRLGGDGLEPRAFVEGVAVSPDFSRDRTVMVSVRGRGLLQSRDGGDSFFDVGGGLKSRNILPAHYPSMTPKFPPIVFSPGYGSNKTVYGFAGPRLFRSVDAGKTWKPVPVPAPSLRVRFDAWWAGKFMPWFRRTDFIPGVSTDVPKRALMTYAAMFLLFVLAVVAAGGVVAWVRRRSGARRMREIR